MTTEQIAALLGALLGGGSALAVLARFLVTWLQGKAKREEIEETSSESRRRRAIEEADAERDLRIQWQNRAGSYRARLIALGADLSDETKLETTIRRRSTSRKARR